ncbi:MAG: hypothetical protein HKN09_12170 [Saprospiraceae bacterium]|nr:hypothetical protein [Saprospiraceae bacterium]
MDSMDIDNPHNPMIKAFYNDDGFYLLVLKTNANVMYVESGDFMKRCIQGEQFKNNRELVIEKRKRRNAEGELRVKIHR